MDEKRKINQLDQRWYVVGPPWGDGTWIVSGSEDPHVGVFVAECESFGISDDELREMHGDIVACAQDKAERIVDEHNKTLTALEAAEARIAELEQNIADAVADAEMFKAENARYRAALEAVEYITDDRSRGYCPWCEGRRDRYESDRFQKPLGHDPDCQRQKALGAQP